MDYLPLLSGLSQAKVKIRKKAPVLFGLGIAANTPYG